MKKLLLLTCILTLGSALQAQTIFWRASTSDAGYTGNYLDGSNYDGTAPQAGNDVTFTGNDVTDGTVAFLNAVAPDAGTFTFRDRGIRIEIRSGGSLSVTGFDAISTFNQGSSTLSIEGGSLTLNGVGYVPSTSGGSDPSRLTLSVSSGNLTFNTGGNTSNGLIQNGSNISISGGTVDLGGARVTISDTSTFTWTGGTLSNVNRFQGDNATNQTLTNDGGTFLVNTNSRTDDLMSYDNGTGTTVFQINNDGSTDAELSQYTGGGVWDLSSGTVAVNFGSYTPQVNDSWDFTALGPGASTFLATGANVASVSDDGLWNVTWDTSNWASAGQLTISNVSAVPEPTALGLAALGLATLLVGRRRRGRNA